MSQELEYGVETRERNNILLRVSSHAHSATRVALDGLEGCVMDGARESWTSRRRLV